jgi:hypothetical protein
VQARPQRPGAPPTVLTTVSIPGWLVRLVSISTSRGVKAGISMHLVWSKY